MVKFQRMSVGPLIASRPKVPSKQRVGSSSLPGRAISLPKSQQAGRAVAAQFGQIRSYQTKPFGTNKYPETRSISQVQRTRMPPKSSRIRLTATRGIPVLLTCVRRLPRLSARTELRRRMALDWTKCAAVESVPGKVSGAWVFRGTRLPVATSLKTWRMALSIEEIMEQFDVTREQVTAVLDFAARSLAAPTRRSLFKLIGANCATPIASLGTTEICPFKGIFHISIYPSHTNLKHR
jgi:uncharacterized protein (DUF433 family)